MSRSTLPAAPARRPPDAPRVDTDTPAAVPEDRPSGEPAEYGPEDFPGCEPFHLPAAEIDRYEGRLEFWEARTETAWKVREPTTIYHERPARQPRPARRAHRVAARLTDRELRFGGPRPVRRGGQQAIARPGRRGAVPAPAPFAGTRAGHRRGQRPAAGRGAGGGPHHGRAKAKALDLRGVEISGGVGAGAAGVPVAPARGRHPPPSGRPLSGGAGERSVPRMAGRRRSTSPSSRASLSPTGKAGPGAGRAGDGGARRHPAGGRSDHPFNRPGGDGDERARGAPRPRNRGHPHPRPSSGPLRLVPARHPDGRGRRVPRRA